MSNHRDGLTKVTIHAAATRPMAFMGAERGPVMFSIIFSAYFIFLLSFRFHVLIGFPVGVSLFGVLLGIFRRMAKKDSQAWKIFWRHIKYKGFYPARGRFGAFQISMRDFK